MLLSGVTICLLRATFPVSPPARGTMDKGKKCEVRNKFCGGLLRLGSKVRERERLGAECDEILVRMLSNQSVAAASQPVAGNDPTSAESSAFFDSIAVSLFGF